MKLRFFSSISDLSFAIFFLFAIYIFMQLALKFAPKIDKPSA